MIKYNEKCLYCDKPLIAKSVRKKFCNDKCRIYYGRQIVYESRIDSLLKEIDSSPTVQQLKKRITDDLLIKGATVIDKGDFLNVSANIQSNNFESTHVKRKLFRDYMSWKRSISDEDEYNNEFLPAVEADEFLTEKEVAKLKGVI